MNEQLEKLLADLKNLKSYIDKGDEAIDTKYAETAEQVASILADSQDLQTKHADFLATNDKMEKRVEFLENLLAKSQKTIGIPGLEEDKDQFSILKAFYAISTNDWDNAGFEKEVFDETRKKAQETGDNTQGGFIVPREVSQDIIEILRPESVVVNMGATVLSDLSGGSWEIPAGKGGIVTYWVGEGDPLTESDETFGQVALRPKEIGALVRMSLNFAKRANPDAESYIRGRLAQELALGIDKAALFGTGGEYQPLGLYYVNGVDSTTVLAGNGTNGGEFQPELIVDLEGVLEDSEALLGNLGLIWNPKIKRKMKKLRIANYSGQTDGMHLFPGFSDASLQDFIGYNYQSTTQIPTNFVKGADSDIAPVFFGNWRDLLIGQWGNFEIASATQAGDVFAKRQMLLRINQEVDINVARKESFAICADAKSS